MAKSTLHWDSIVLVIRNSRCFSLAPYPLLLTGPLVLTASPTPVKEQVMGGCAHQRPSQSWYSQLQERWVGRKPILVANMVDHQLSSLFSWTYKRPKPKPLEKWTFSWPGWRDSTSSECRDQDTLLVLHVISNVPYPFLWCSLGTSHPWRWISFLARLILKDFIL